MAVPNITPEATGPIVTKFYVEPFGAQETKTCLNDPGPLTNKVAMPVDSKNL